MQNLAYTHTCMRIYVVGVVQNCVPVAGAMETVMCKYTNLFVWLQPLTRTPAVNVRHRFDGYILDLEDDRTGELVWEV